MRFAIKHKLLLLLLLSITFSMLLVGVTLSYFTFKYHDTEAKKEVHKAFMVLESTINDRDTALSKNISLLAHRDDIIASVNMIDEYQDIENYIPLIFDIEKQHIARDMVEQASIASIDLITMYDSSGELISFCWKEDAGYRLGIVSYKEGRPLAQLTDIDQWDTWVESSLPMKLEEAQPSVPEDYGRIVYRSIEHGFMIEANAPIIRIFPDKTTRTVGSIKMASIMSEDFARQIAEKTNLRFGIFVDSMKAAGNLDAGLLPKSMPQPELLFNRERPDTTGWLGHEHYYLHAHSILLEGGKRANLIFGIEKVHLRADTRRTLMVVISVLVLSALVVVPASFYIAKWSITDPVIRLANGVESLKDGIYDKPVAVKTSDEIGLLASSFNDMALTIHQRQEELKESEKKYRNLFASIRDVIIVADQERVIVDANQPALRDLFGYELEDVVGRKTKFLYETNEAFQYTGKKIFNRDAASSSSVLEVNLKKKSGDIFTGEMLAMKLLNERRDLVGNLGIIRDITERKKAEGFIRDILESVGEGFIVVDPSYTILSANKAFGEQMGMPNEEIAGKHCHDISHRSPVPCFESGEECPVRETFRTGEPSSALHIHSDEESNPLYVEIRAYPIKDASGTVTSAIEIINDITEKKELEQQLRQSQKMQAIGTLTGGLAHDFNNLLTTIVGYGELLRNELETNASLKNYVDMIMASAEKASSLTQSLLAFSRKQIIHPVELDINDTIRKAANLFSRLIGEDIEVKLHLSEEPLTILADSLQMEQILMNLYTNARDAMPNGGQLIIRTEPKELDSDFVHAHGLGQPGWYVMISVSDTGIGMDEKIREQIFEPFFTTKEVGKGTGLGLSVVYGIVQQHNGLINVCSEPGQGTTFKIYLPLIKLREEVQQAVVQTAAPKGGSETILVAEDDPGVRGYIKTTLERFGYTVLEAKNGEDAVKAFKENKDSVHLVLLDVIMPKKNGIEAFKEIIRVSPTVKVLFVSGYPRDVLEKYDLMDEAELIVKPVLPAELLQGVRNVLDKQNGPLEKASNSHGRSLTSSED